MSFKEQPRKFPHCPFFWGNFLLLNHVETPVIYVKTRMTTFTKKKFNKSDDQTNIDNIELLLILN